MFITIDPAARHAAALALYAGNFHPRLVGLTGSEEEIADVAKAYRVYYAKAKGRPAVPDYLMDHSSIIYLMGPDGQFVKPLHLYNRCRGPGAGTKAIRIRALKCDNYRSDQRPVAWNPDTC